MQLPTTSKQWILREKPRGEPVLPGAGENPTFELREAALPASLADGQLLLRTLYLGNDPAQRNFISPSIPADRLYTALSSVGDHMRGAGIAEVLRSRCPDVPAGSLVMGETGWREFVVAEAGDYTVLQPIDGLSVTHFLGALGLSGFVAYYGLREIARAKAEDVVVVSGAGGAIGMMAVQIAKKIIGCRKVIGIAGTDDKCRRVQKMGADVCVNYKSASFREELVKETDGYVNVYFDNVGGEILDLMLTRMAKFGRVAACGAVSNYNREGDPVGIKNYFDVIAMRIQITGLIMTDWFEHLPETVGILASEWQKGNIVVDDECETVVEADFEDIPRTWAMLFSGGNTGKLVTKLKV